MSETTSNAEMVSLTVDGQTVSVPKGTLLIEACRQLGVDVPFFCYHEHMSPVGACRMCLVKVEGVPKPVTSCTTTVTDGMVVHSNTDEVLQWREGIVGFLLANHPLECPTCDKGGECDLQNISFKFGPRHSLFQGAKRHFIDYDMGPTVVRDMDRCIQCQRCIRFGLEWSGDHGLDFFGRGAAMSVGTFARGHFVSKFSGNVTEVCPVGALTSEPFRLTARPWEMSAEAGVCNHCSVGCNQTLWSRQNRLLRITARENTAVNVAWSCDKGKFGLDFVNSERRLKTPAVVRDGRLVPASWREALTLLAGRLCEVKAQYGPDAVGFIGGQKCSNEDVFMFQRLAREAVGTRNIDHRMAETLPAALVPGTGIPLDAIESARVIVLFQADVREEAPVVWLRVHHAKVAGSRIIVVDERGTEADAFAEDVVRLRPGGEVEFLTELSHALSGGGASEAVSRVAAAMKDGCVVVAGPRVAQSPGSADIVRALWQLADARPGIRWGLLHANNNTRGAYDMGASPDAGPGCQPLARPGMGTAQMLQAAAEGRIKALYLMGADPLANFPDAALARKALETVPFLVVQDILRSDLSEQADIVLPAVTYAEREGTYTNSEGRIQYFRKAVEPRGSARPDWEICAGAMAALGVEPGVRTLKDVVAQIVEAVPEYENAAPDRIPPEGTLQMDRRVEIPPVPTAAPAPAEGSAGLPLVLLTGDVLFDHGALTQDVQAFQELQPHAWVDVSFHDAEAAGIADGDTVSVATEFAVVDLPARVGDRVQPGTIFIPRKVGSFRSNRLTSVRRAVQCARIQKGSK
jgi:NADH-quinone oxidoreductase subunit G